MSCTTRNLHQEKMSEYKFECNEQRGIVFVSVDPSSEIRAKGFPRCKATLEFRGDGYKAFFGWIQLVRSTDNTTEGK